MSDKIVFVTGAAGGIGRATAQMFASRDYKVVVTDLGRRSDLEALADELGGLALDLDVSNRADVADAIAQTEADVGPIGTAICCAGFDADRTLEQTDDAMWDRSMHVLLGGCVNVIAAVAPAMKQRSTGSIVNISSELAIIGEENHVSYVSAKAAILGLTRAMAHELGPHGIRVNSVAPGPTDTPMLTDRYRADPAYLQRIPLKRFGAPEELARAITDLSESTWTTGQIVSPNGGIVIQ